MVQDFAKKKARSEAPANSPAQPPAWNLLLTGLVTGLALGVFISFLAYISGVLPAVPATQGTGQQARVGETQTQVDEEAQSRLTEELERAAARLQLEFYQELPNYEVVVDATPLDLPGSDRTALEPPEQDQPTSQDQPARAADRGSASFMVQAGAFQQENAAIMQRERLEALGLQAQVKQEALLGRTLFLVQSGPYLSREELARAERLLRNNNIETMRITQGSR